MAYKFIEGFRLTDWVIYCAICGSKTWASDSFILDNYTGRGGLRVCPDCNDPIDYGLVPYKIPAEQPVPYVNYLLPTPPVDNAISVETDGFDPLNSSGTWSTIAQVWSLKSSLWNKS